MYIQTDDGTEISTTMFYLSDECDFSPVEVQGKRLKLSRGILTDDDTFIPDKILEIDMTPCDDSIVYKWGATTGLTSGKYKGLLCTRKDKTGSYDINTYMIEGQSEQFSKEGDSGSLVCINPDSITYSKHMAAFILIGGVKTFDAFECQNLYACYRVCVALSEIKRSKACKKIETCFQ